MRKAAATETAPFETSVAVIGGGISGITAAVKLYQQGFDVTIFEKGTSLGGNLSSNSIDNKNTPRDVYPHIFGDWYKEFWYLLEEDFGIKRGEWFVRRDKIRMAMIPADTSGLTVTGFDKVEFAILATPTSLANLTDDLFSNILSQRDMFLFGYSFLDLISVPRLRTSKVLSELDVTGYLYSRPFVDNEIADLHDDILKLIWSMPTNQTSASAYQALMRHTQTFPNETPFAWQMNRPAGMLMDEITKQLKGQKGERITVKLKTQVNELILDQNDKYVELRIGDAKEKPFRFRYAVVATPPLDAVGLVLTKAPSKKSLVERQPSLACLREAEFGRIPVIYLSFHKDFLAQHQSDLSALPNELTAFRSRPAQVTGSSDAKARDNTVDYDISMLNLTGLWTVDPLNPNVAASKMGPDVGPVLVIAASHSTAIEARGPDEDEGNKGEGQGFAMLKKLQGYLPFFDPGDYWEDNSKRCVNWERTRVITNSDYKLFLNDVDSDKWRPRAQIQNVKNVFFAGDYCHTDVDMATVEAAVQSGVLAAQALQAAAGVGHPIELQPHDIYTSNALLLGKLTLLPAAFVAAVTATYEDSCEDPVGAMELPYTVAVLAIAFWADWLRSAMDFWRGCVPRQYQMSPSGAPAQGGVADHDRRIGVAELLVGMVMALVVEGPTVAPRLAGDAAEAAYTAWYWAIGRLLYPGLPKKLPKPAIRPATSPPTQARVSGDRVPSTWSDLLPASITPRDLSTTAFGVAAGAVRLFETLVDRNKISPPEGAATRRTTGPPAFSDHLREAVKAGKQACALNRAAFRQYPVVNSVRQEQR
jgi:predicted NAD/FAD-binding protein